MNFRAGIRRRDEQRIEIAPLIDVIFLLIIFLLMTTTFRKKEHAFKIVLPSATHEKIVQLPRDRTSIFISAEGDFFYLPQDTEIAPEDIDEYKVTMEELEKKLQGLAKEDRMAPLFIRASREAKYQFVVDVLSRISGEGLENLQLSYERLLEAPESKD